MTKPAIAKRDALLIYTDHDGTLAANNLIPAQNLEAMAQFLFHRKDRFIVDSSARPAQSVYQELKNAFNGERDLTKALEQGRILPAGFNGGICTLGPVGKEAPREHPFPLAVTLNIYKTSKGNGCVGLFYTRNEVHSINQDAWLSEIASYLNYALTNSPPKMTRADPIFMIDLKVPEGTTPLHVKHQAGIDLWQRKNNQQVTTYSFLPPRDSLPDQSLWLQAIPSEVNKAHALHYYMKQLHAPAEQTLVLGDGRNDLKFLSEPGVMRAIPENASGIVLQYFDHHPNMKVYHAPSAKDAGFSSAVRTLITLS